ncbi:unnamed protein product [marine sediment metagenome]|uniref:SpoVT-AbrB domain-containing protein n=1 Tax=marine sediment metagenome TaxID=412755 RepID=X1ESI8_9ZZZZ
MSVEEKEESFVRRIVVGGRVTVPYEIREKLGLKKGDLVNLKIRKVEQGKE